MKRALVTGGSGDIGSSICNRLAEDGFHVIVHASSRPERAQSVVDKISASGGSAEAVAFDLTDPETTKQAAEQLLASGPIQVLVSNAGIHQDAPLAGMTREQWSRVIDVSLNGFFNVCQPLLLPMMQTRWGRVVAISSIAGQLGNKGQANYAAAKSGLHGAIKSLSLELASRGITANVVAPGIIAGTMTESVFNPEYIKEHVPAKRVGQPEEVASLVAYLASEQAGYVTGQVIGINGGLA